MMTKEDLARQTEFYQKRGFIAKNRAWESRLDLSTFDHSKFHHYLDRVAREGVTFTTLAQEKKDEPFLRQLHELVQLINEDMPREAPFTPLSYEQWKAFSYDNPRVIPEGYWIARKDSQLVGLSDVHRNEKTPGGLSQDDTGVRREYRSRGIATALKVKVIEWAKQNGFKSIKTWNDSKNVPMLAVNTRLGFKRQVGWVLMQKDLG
jgi:GNAT superfamily N-acetyltransferase